MFASAACLCLLCMVCVSVPAGCAVLCLLCVAVHVYICRVWHVCLCLLCICDLWEAEDSSYKKKKDSSGSSLLKPVTVKTSRTSSVTETFSHGP